MSRGVGVSDALPSAHANRSLGDDDTASSAPAEELLQSSSIWQTANLQGSVTEDTLEAQSKPDFDFDDNNSPSSSVHSSVIDLSSAAASHSDFELLEDQEYPQTDGQNEYISSGNRSSAISGLLSRAKRKAWRISRGSGGGQAEVGASTMEAGSSSSAPNYDDSEWQQAGPNADAVDLAGPGAQGFLECSVSNPQKEGEGTQNAYISYLVTTDVSISDCKNLTEALTNLYV
jgi:hypothetical protein